MGSHWRPNGDGGALSLSYDLNGNQTAGPGLLFAYISFDLPTTITRGTTQIKISCDTEHQRFRQISPSGTTLYLWDPGAAA